MKCPHCGGEIMNGEDFALKPVTRASLIRAKQYVIGSGPHVKVADLLKIKNPDERQNRYLEIPAIGGSVRIGKQAVDDWSDVYPAVDVGRTLCEIEAWVLANAQRKKVNVRAFIVNWLKREQDRG